MKPSEEEELLPRGKPWIRPWMRRIVKRFLWYRFLLFHRGRYDRLVLERAGGRSILVLPKVFNPVLLTSGAFLAAELDRGLIPDGAEVLDLGCGSGIGGAAASGAASHVVCADVNPAAVRCARINALLNRVEERVETLESDLFSALEGRRFDVVLFNPPFYRGEATEGLDHAWRATDTLERFAAELSAHLTPGGFALVVFSTDGDLAGLLQALRAEQLFVELLVEKDAVNEILVLYRVSVGPRQA